VQAIELYRPAPPPGTRVPIRLEVVELDREQRRLVANMEVQDGSGQVWFRIRGWQDILFRHSDALLRVQRLPTRYTLAQERDLAGLPPDGLAVMLPRADLRDAQPERLAQLFLNEQERSEFEAHATRPRRQRAWLMGRIAAKDAARLWLSRRTGRPPLHPAQLIVSRDEQGKPEVRLPEEAERAPSPAGQSPSIAAPRISIAHSTETAVAVAAGEAIGVDVELPDAGSRLRLEDFATPGEIRQLRDLGDGEVKPPWATRLWCSKEAAAKLLGGGLGGRPKSIEATHVETDGRLWMSSRETERSIEVRTCQVEGSLLAVARLVGDETQASEAG
jgi:phosphopantetheinyl transferase